MTVRMALTRMLEYPIPLTPRFAESDSVETRHASNKRDRTNFAPEIIYTDIYLPAAMIATHRNLYNIPNIFAIDSILI